MIEANRLLAAAQEIQDFCTERNFRFCFIGGIAVQHWGESRLTRDADLTVFTGIGDEPIHVDALLSRFSSRVADGREFALKHRVLLLRASNGIPLDISLGALAFEEKAVAAATMEEIAPGTALRLCGPGALIVFKAFAGRPQDWLDIEGIAAKSSALIEWQDIRADLMPLLELKGDTDTLGRLERMLAAR